MNKKFESLVKEGFQFYSLKEYSKAIGKFSNAIDIAKKTNHNCPEIYYHRGLCYWEIRFLKVTKKDQLLSTKDLIKLARIDFCEALEKNSKDPDVIKMCGITLFEEKRYPEAKEKFIKYIEYNPADLQVYNKLVIIYESESEFIDWTDLIKILGSAILQNREICAPRIEAIFKLNQEKKGNIGKNQKLEESDIIFLELVLKFANLLYDKGSEKDANEVFFTISRNIEDYFILLIEQNLDYLTLIPTIEEQICEEDEDPNHAIVLNIELCVKDIKKIYCDLLKICPEWQKIRQHLLEREYLGRLSNDEFGYNSENGIHPLLNDDEYMQLMDKFNRKFPNNFMLQYQIGRGYRQLFDKLEENHLLGAAIDCFKKAIINYRIKNDEYQYCCQSHWNLAQLFQYKKRWFESIDELDWLLFEEVCIDKKIYSSSLANIYKKMGKYQKALDILENNTTLIWNNQTSKWEPDIKYEKDVKNELKLIIENIKLAENRLDDFELRFRQTINVFLRKHKGNNYFDELVTQHKDNKAFSDINDRIQYLLSSFPQSFEKDLINPLDFFTISEYFDLIKMYWKTDFKEIFVHEQKLKQRFNFINDFRNAIKHNRPCNIEMIDRANASLNFFKEIMQKNFQKY